MKSWAKLHGVDLVLIGVVAGLRAHEGAVRWMSWRRVVRELRHLKVGQL